MEERKVRLRYSKPADIKNIIDLQAQLDRPLPKSKYESRKFQEIVENYIQSNPTKGNCGIILAMSGP
jgi:hypothetical protein